MFASSMKRITISAAVFFVLATAGARAAGPLSITVKAEGEVAHIRIIGTIYSGWHDSDFRMQVDEMKKKGITRAHVYLNTRGGDVFAANEIVNIIKTFDGDITGEGGALVASAGTYIAVKLKSFKMASNGQMMIHKPYGYIEGDANAMERAVKLLRNLEEDYAKAYADKTGMKIEEVKALYETGDYWISAEEALAQKFIDGITGEEVITEETRAMYAACGRIAPVATAIANQPSKQTITDNMDLKLMAVALGLVATATEAEVTAEIKRLRDVEAELKGLKNERSAAAAATVARTITDAVSAAIEKKQIAPDAKDYMITKLQAAAAANTLEVALAELKAMPEVKSLTANVVTAPVAGGAAPAATPDGRGDWTLQKWQEEDPRGLRQMHTGDYERFNALYKAAHGKDAPRV